MNNDQLSINNYQLPEGYKQTEVGVIPEDWDVVALGEFTDKVGSGITPTGGARVYKDSGRSFIRSQNVGWGTLKLDDLAYIDEETHQSFVASEIREKDVLLNITGASIGRSSIADIRIAGGNVNQHVCIIRTNQNQLNSAFLNFLLLSKNGQKQIDSFQAGGNREGLNFGQIRSFKIRKPRRIEEQRLIAQALSDVDALTAALDKLIAKKRNLKTATMQQLLTGKKRLPGFGEGQDYKESAIGLIPEDWDVSQVTQVTSAHKQGYYTKERYVEHGIRLLRITDLCNPKIDYGSMPMLSVSDNDFEQYKISKGDFLFARSGAIGRYGIVEDDVSAIFGSYIIRFNFNAQKLLNSFFGYLFETQIIWKQLLSITQGSSNININAGNIKALKIPLPHSREQRAIATVLSGMDAEIAALESRLAKTQAIKQGMMQELLTGKIRLKIKT